MSFKKDCEESEEVTLWRIRHWCNMAAFAPSKKEHMQYHPLPEDLPDEDTILKSQLPDDWVGEGGQSYLAEARCGNSNHTRDRKILHPCFGYRLSSAR